MSQYEAEKSQLIYKKIKIKKMSKLTITCADLTSRLNILVSGEVLFIVNILDVVMVPSSGQRRYSPIVEKN